MFSSTVTFNLRFPGQYYDEGTGQFYNHNRYYNPELGRYMEPDPIGLEGGLNPYVYAGNNPVMNVDPSGLSFTAPMTDPLSYSINNTLNFNNIAGLQFSFERNLANASYELTNRNLLAVDNTTQAQRDRIALYEGGGVKQVTYLEETFIAPIRIIMGGYSRANNMMNMAKPRNAPPPPSPEAKGNPHSIIEKSGKDGQYTTYFGDGTWKQYRGSGQDHGGIPRPNVKETTVNYDRNGKPHINKAIVRIPRTDEIP